MHAWNDDMVCDKCGMDAVAWINGSDESRPLPVCLGELLLPVLSALDEQTRRQIKLDTSD